MTFAAQSFVVAVNHLLAREPWARARLVPYAGKRARLVCANLVLTLRVQPDGCFAAVDEAASAGAGGQTAAGRSAAGDGFAAAGRASGKTAAGGGAAFPGETGQFSGETRQSGQSSQSAFVRSGQPGRAEHAGDPNDPGVPDDAQPIDVTLSIPVDALSAFVQGGQAAAMKHVRIEGDAEFAQTLGKLAEHLRWEPEEDLARLVGDAFAVRIVSSARAASGQMRRATRNLLDSVAEYLINEKALLVRRAELDDFNAELARARDALARAEKRVERLEGARYAERAARAENARRAQGARHVQSVESAESAPGHMENRAENRTKNAAENATESHAENAAKRAAPDATSTTSASSVPSAAPRTER